MPFDPSNPGDESATNTPPTPAPPQDRWSGIEAGLKRQIAGKQSLEALYGQVVESNMTGAPMPSGAAGFVKSAAKAGGLQLSGEPTAADSALALPAIEAAIKTYDVQINDSLDRMQGIDPQRTVAVYGDYYDAARIKDLRTTLGLNPNSGLPYPGAGGYVQPMKPDPYQFQVGSGGEVVRFNPNNGQVELTGQVIPALAKKPNVQVVTDTKTGHAYAVNMDDVNAPRVDLGEVAFPEVDPAEKFRHDVLANAATIEQSMAGIELQRRGTEVAAIGTDMANAIELGKMTYTEAAQRLNTIDSALTQRRDERAQVLQYGIAKSAVQYDSQGNAVTQFPFAKQIAGILSSATGQAFDPSQFNLGVTAINPDQAAQDVMNAGAVQSPIPGLAAKLQSTQAAVASIIGAPMPATPASSAVVAQATKGA